MMTSDAYDETFDLNSLSSFRTNSAPQTSANLSDTSDPQAEPATVLKNGPRRTEKVSCGGCGDVLLERTDFFLYHVLRFHWDEPAFPCTMPGCSRAYRSSSAAWTHTREAHRQTAAIRAALRPDTRAKAMLLVHRFFHTAKPVDRSRQGRACQLCDPRSDQHSNLKPAGKRRHVLLFHTSQYSEFCILAGCVEKTDLDKAESLVLSCFPPSKPKSPKPKYSKKKRKREAVDRHLVCRLCSQALLITGVKANQSTRVHVRKHSLRPYYACPLPPCEFTAQQASSVHHHVRQRHAELHDKPQPKRLIFSGDPHDTALFEACFGSEEAAQRALASLEVKILEEKPTIGRIQICQICSKAVRLEDKPEHVARFHFGGRRPFGCPICDFHSAYKSSASTHLLLKHGFKGPLRPMKEAMANELKDQIRKAFG